MTSATCCFLLLTQPIIHQHVSLSSHSNQQIAIWILARRGVKGCQICVSGTNPCPGKKTTVIYGLHVQWGVICGFNLVSPPACVKAACLSTHTGGLPLSLLSEALCAASGLAAVKQWRAGDGGRRQTFPQSSRESVCFSRLKEKIRMGNGNQLLVERSDCCPSQGFFYSWILQPVKQV